MAELADGLLEVINPLIEQPNTSSASENATTSTNLTEEQSFPTEIAVEQEDVGRGYYTRAAPPEMSDVDKLYGLGPAKYINKKSRAMPIAEQLFAHAKVVYYMSTRDSRCGHIY